MYLLSSSIRRIALLLNVGKSTVHYWIEKFKDPLWIWEKRKTTRNALVAHPFLREVLRKYGVEELILDKGPWYRSALQSLDVNCRHGIFGGRNLVESFFSSFKQKVRIFFSSITVNLGGRDRRGWEICGALECWNRFCRCLCFTLMWWEGGGSYWSTS